MWRNALEGGTCNPWAPYYAAGVALLLSTVTVWILTAIGITQDAVLIALLLIPLIVFGMTSGSLSELAGPLGIVAKFAKLETAIEETKREAAKTREQIANLFLMSMSEDLYWRLKDLDHGWPGHFWLDPELKSGLAQELNFLKQLGYIAFDKSHNCKGVEDLPKGDAHNLSQYISVTSLGKRFLTLREEASKLGIS